MPFPAIKIKGGKMIKYTSRKFLLICLAWGVYVIAALIGVIKGFPKEQAQQAWDFLRSTLPFLLALTGWYFREDIAEKKVLSEIKK